MKKLQHSYFNISTGQVILGHDVVIDVDVRGQRHATRVDREDSPLRLLIREGKLDLTVNPAWADQGWVQSLDSVGGHDNLQKDGF